MDVLHIKHMIPGMSDTQVQNTKVSEIILGMNRSSILHFNGRTVFLYVMLSRLFLPFDGSYGQNSLSH